MVQRIIKDISSLKISRHIALKKLILRTNIHKTIDNGVKIRQIHETMED